MAVIHRPPLKVGVIGVGRHGSRYLRHIVLDLPEVMLTAICRRDGTRGRDPILDAAIPCCTDYRELVGASYVDAVIVVVPPALNHEMCLAAIGAKKPVLVEKPLATTGEEADAIVRAAYQAGVALMTAQTLRFDSTIVRLKQTLPEAGALRYLSLTLRLEPHQLSQAAAYKGRGVLLEIGIHLLDLVRFLTGEEVIEVRCQMDQMPPAAAESHALAWLRTAGGNIALLDISRVSSGRVGRAEWIGEKGQLAADWQAHELTFTSASLPTRKWTVDSRPTIVETVRSFVRTVRDGIPPAIDGGDGKRAVEIAEACYQSAQRHGESVPVHYR